MHFSLKLENFKGKRAKEAHLPGFHNLQTGLNSESGFRGKRGRASITNILSKGLDVRIRADIKV